MTSTTFGVFDLRDTTVWDTGHVLLSGFQWPEKLSSVRLAEVATLLEPRHFVQDGAQVVAPEGLDHVYGGVRRRVTNFQGIGYLVGGDEVNVQPGDLLIPRTSGAPALLVGEDLLGAAISDEFLAYRFADPDEAYWVWGVLCSTSGRQYFRAAQVETLAGRSNRVADLAIPWPNNERMAGLRVEIAAVELQTHRPVEEAVETWWSTADLRNVGWRLALATPHPAEFLEGTELETLGFEITPGRASDRHSVPTIRVDGSLPVVSMGVLGGRPVTKWMVESASTIVAEPGDVLVAGMMTRANARVATERCVLDATMYRVRPPEGVRPESVVRFFNGQVGHGLRQLALSGMTIPRITPKDFRQLRVPDEAFEVGISAGPVESLGEQLEQVLWPN